ncbi:hypothetical protein [Microbacterium oxydans]|uniref:DUF4145 domain-containing protein n=1 Tax=Microbacterium oxydans TaxID=82380 RepID=A0A0F0L6L7_9MICO|nr:hypothetical protein [Microbacterium oxydans]KJL28783.1 hypothetical protein RS83_02264 [Microbacterium oxydans]
MELQDWLDTVLEYLKVIAWPVTVIGLLVFFRSEIRKLVGRIRRFKGMGVEADLAEEMSEVAAESEKIPELQTDLGAALIRQQPQPAASLLGRMLIAWSELELEARAAAVRQRMAHGGTNLGVLFGQLRKDGLVSVETEDTARRMQEIRNQIVHRASGLLVDPSFVEHFEEATNNLAIVLRAIPEVESTV